MSKESNEYSVFDRIMDEALKDDKFDQSKIYPDDYVPHIDDFRFDDRYDKYYLEM
jgi:hypothetical protein